MNITDLKHIDLNIDLQQSVSSDIANHFLIVPKAIDDSENSYYIDELKASEQSSIKEELKLIFNKNIVLESVDSSIIKKTLSIYYRKHDDKPKLVS